ncbi:hypothetical protein C5167_039832 [Papaver somniferum]|uniref:Uncharacterized protein n=1 Tax=Papaver somniferum TaxID=3469 RepID=A0A4Y7IDH7_PAPSO|nr:hypothetical protein C5167_039832 [Papaver somniferum]
MVGRITLIYRTFVIIRIRKLGNCLLWLDEFKGPDSDYFLYYRSDKHKRDADEEHEKEKKFQKQASY